MNAEESMMSSVSSLSFSSAVRTSQSNQVTPTLWSPSNVKRKEKKLSEAFGAHSKLQFDSVGLVGRENERAKLIQSLERLVADEDDDSTAPKKRREIILVGGESGTGKTALAQTLEDLVVKQYKGSFVSSKYDAKFRDQPFSGISEACNELCRELLEKKSSEQDLVTVRKELFDIIDKSQLELLETTIPMLSILAIGNGKNNDNETGGEAPAETPLENIPPQEEDACTAADETRKTNRKRISIFRRRSTIRSKGTKNELMSLADDSRTSTVNNRRATTTPIEPKNAKEILKMAFLRLIRVLTSRQKVTIILLDDLQWADSSSLELFEAIFNDSHVTNLMLIGCYRSDEVDERHIFSQTIRKLKDAQAKNKLFNINEVSVGNLSLSAINLYVGGLLSISEPSKTLGLSTVCHKRTLGNIFFVKVFLASLQEASLLEFNTNIFQWRWDESQIELQTAATGNLITLLTSKMNKFSKEVLLLLKIASCLGNIFRRSTILFIWENLEKLDEEEEKTVSLDELLQVAVDEMFFEVLPDESFRFVHDKVQEAASSLIPVHELIAFQREIGILLYQELNEDDLDRMIFVVVDLLNSHSGTEDHEAPQENFQSIILEVAALNLKAASKSLDLSAFANAARYAKLGIKYLGHTKTWDDNFDLRLQLCIVGAEAYYCAENHEEALGYCELVKKQERATIFEKHRVLEIMITILYGNTKYDEGWAVCMEVLDALGFRYPKNRGLQKLKAASYLRETKKHYLPTPEEVGGMPFVSDERIVSTVSLLVRVAEKAIFSNVIPIYTLVCCENIRLAKKHGLTEFTAAAFCSFANVLMHRYGDWATARKIADTVVAIRPRLSSNFSKTSATLKPNLLVLSWIKPYRGCWGEYMEAYRLGILSGNIEGGLLAVFAAILCQFSTGSQLQSVEEDARIYVPQIVELNNVHIAVQLRLLWQLTLNLIGDESNPNTTEMTGSVIEENELAVPFLKMLAKLWTCFACMIFGEYEKGAETNLEYPFSNYYKKFLGANYSGQSLFSRGLCLYASARLTKNKKHLKAAREIRQTLKKWVKKGGVNFLHQLHILNAEEAAWTGNESLAKKCYGEGIRTAARSGFIHDAGVANERYSLFLYSINELAAGEDYLMASIQCYCDWGAKRKVDMLQERLRKQREPN